VLVTDGETPASLCGACRQVLAEFSPEIEVFMCNLEGKMVHTTVAKLLPYSFVFKKTGEE
jgi:cytidine deaminase